jgi:hypothetical protein
MLPVLKKLYKFVTKLFLAIGMLLFIAYILIALINDNLLVDSKVINRIALLGMLLAMPGIIDTFAKEFNTSKKNYKLMSKCPTCDHEIEFEMKEL